MTQIIPLIPRRVIPQEEVTVAQLCSILDRAFIDYEVEEDGDLYLTDGIEFPCWVTIDTDRKLLNFFTFDEIEERPESERLILINKMNKNILLTRFSLKGNRIWGDYFMPFREGLNVRQFIDMLRGFSGGFLAGIRIECDEMA